jgi:acetyl-CoA decarbonylase/synthase complex subunit delta
MPDWKNIIAGYELPDAQTQPTLRLSFGELKLGGRRAMPFFEPSPLNVALGLTILPAVDGKPEILAQALGGESYLPIDYARHTLDSSPDFLFLPLAFELEEGGTPSPEEIERATTLARQLTELSDIPLVVEISAEKRLLDNLLPVVCPLLRSGKDWLGRAGEDNYRTFAAACQAYDLGVLAQSPMDINLAKQLNILLHNCGIPYERILHDPLTGGLGYGTQYTLSVIERLRLAALGGDGATSGLILINSGEAWSGRECYQGEGPLGNPRERAPLWEAETALAGIIAGADLCALLHPQAYGYLRSLLREMNSQPGDDS